MEWNYLSIPELQWFSRWSLAIANQFHPTLYKGCKYVFMPGLNLSHVSKRGLKDVSVDIPVTTAMNHLSQLTVINAYVNSSHLTIRWKINQCTMLHRIYPLQQNVWQKGTHFANGACQIIWLIVYNEACRTQIISNCWRQFQYIPQNVMNKYLWANLLL